MAVAYVMINTDNNSSERDFKIDESKKIDGLSGNALKIIAAIFMLIDHIGFILFPQVKVLRIIGRIAFPIYAFMIAEGCEHTKNKLRYFLSIFILGIICQAAYFIYDGSFDMGILITFSIAVILIYAMQNLKKILFSSSERTFLKVVGAFMFLLLVAIVYLLNNYIYIDYGFMGCMMPVFASIFRETKSELSPQAKKTVNVLMLGIGLIILSCVIGGIQRYSLYAIPLLLLYSGKRGKWKMKSFFYIFYPAHLVILEAISMFL